MNSTDIIDKLGRSSFLNTISYELVIFKAVARTWTISRTFRPLINHLDCNEVIISTALLTNVSGMIASALEIKARNLISEEKQARRAVMIRNEITENEAALRIQSCWKRCRESKVNGKPGQGIGRDKSDLKLIDRLKLALAKSKGSKLDTRALASEIMEYSTRIPKFQLPDSKIDWANQATLWQQAFEQGEFRGVDCTPDPEEHEKIAHESMINRRVNGWWDTNSSDLDVDFESFIQDIIEDDMLTMADQC